jgi:hypothetical protein
VLPAELLWNPASSSRVCGRPWTGKLQPWHMEREKSKSEPAQDTFSTPQRQWHGCVTRLGSGLCHQHLKFPVNFVQEASIFVLHHSPKL